MTRLSTFISSFNSVRQLREWYKYYCLGTGTIFGPDHTIATIRAEDEVQINDLPLRNTPMLTACSRSKQSETQPFPSLKTTKLPGRSRWGGNPTFMIT